MCGCNPRRGAGDEMYVVGKAFYLSKVYIVLARNGSENVYYTLFGLSIRPDVLAILSAPGKVVPEIIASMAGMFYAHQLIFYHLVAIFRTIALVAPPIPRCQASGLAGVLSTNKLAKLALRIVG